MSNATKQTVSALASSFLAAARGHGFTVTIRSESVVMISKRFAVGDLDAFTGCDCFGPMLLDMVPLKGGSVWGTDGGSVGGYSAVKNGQYMLYKSGNGGKRFLTALRAALEVQS